LHKGKVAKYFNLLGFVAVAKVEVDLTIAKDCGKTKLIRRQ